MARQRGQHPFTGKMSGTIGYKFKDEYLERENGNKEGKRFRRDPKRVRTMQCAYAFGGVSKAMKPFYRKLSVAQRQHGVFGALTGKATKLMRAGKTMEEVLVLFRQWESEAGVVSKAECGVRAEARGSVVSSAGGDGVVNSPGVPSVSAPSSGVAGMERSTGSAGVPPLSAVGVAPQQFYVIAIVPAPRFWQSM